MSRGTSRRTFVQGAALAGVGVWVGTSRNAWAQERSPNERLQIASIGVGGKGDSDSDQAAKVGALIAICDVDEKTLANKAEKHPKTKRFHDFREMLDKMGKDIDAVTVSCPDHNHALAALSAIKMGKHVYCQKPMTHDVWEARQMREMAKKMKICTQMGNQGTAENGLRRGVELIRAGVIGPVKEVHVWTNRPIWPQAPEITSRADVTEKPVPQGLHWDQFLGTAPERPYGVYKDGKGAYHTFNWRGWWDFGTGALGDMACHTANLPFMALKLGHPTSLQGESGDLNPETYPAWAKVAYEFPARGDMPACKVHWYEGHMHEGGKTSKVLPPEELLAPLPKQRRRGVETVADSASLIVGEKGMLYSPDDYGADWVIVMDGKTMKFGDNPFKDEVPTSLPRNGEGDQGMKNEWAAAIKAGKPEIALSNFDYAGMLTEFVVLGNVAVRAPHTKLMWDGPGLKISNNADANKFLKREYRKGWEVTV